MKSKKTAHFEEICEILDRCFPDPQIPLHFVNAYTLLVAVVLSAQCTDKRVNEVTPELWKYGTTPAEIAALGREKIEEIIKPCGLYTRKSQSIFELSQILDTQYHGQVPCERKELESLPGVGRKTANVILSHVFKIPAFAVDTHIMRLAKRWGWSKASTPEGVERDLCALFPESEWEKRHLQLIYFGRTYCKATGHDSNQCPVCSLLMQA
jgi:endonuclease-3